MANIKIHLRDGSTREFLHEGRSGGSYTKTLRYEGVFAIVRDEWGKEVAIPAELISSIEEIPLRWWR